jgi:hypothetical protein
MNKQTEKILKAIREACPELKVPKDLPLPVKYDGMMYYWGKNGEMVADFDNGVSDGEGFRIRGWGRIQDEESQDECANWIADAINTHAEPHLEDLLRTAFIKEVSLNISQLGEVFQIKNGERVYSNTMNLTLSLTQNLETNQELRDFIYKLVCKD